MTATRLQPKASINVLKNTLKGTKMVISLKGTFISVSFSIPVNNFILNKPEEIAVFHRLLQGCRQFGIVDQMWEEMAYNTMGCEIPVQGYG